MLYPMKLQAPLKDYLWGGTKLKEEYGKKSDLAKVAESWELSCHEAGKSIIRNGAAAGMTLSDWIEKEGKDVAPDGLAAGKSSDLEERRPAFNDGEILEAIEQILKVSVHALAPSLALTTSMKFLICCQCASTISSRFVGLHRSNVRRPTVISENFSKLIAGIKSVKYAHH